MLYRTISNWLRQTRHRAKKHNIYNDLEQSDIKAVTQYFNGKCAYCDRTAITLDLPFPLRDKAPGVAANLVTSCLDCKRHKRSNDLIWMYSSGMIDRDRYLKILTYLFQQRGNELMKQYVGMITGLA